METVVNRNQVGASAALTILLFAADCTGAIAAEKTKINHSDLTVMKKSDKASPNLYEATSKGKHIPKANIEMTKTAPPEPRLNQSAGSNGKR